MKSRKIKNNRRIIAIVVVMAVIGTLIVQRVKINRLHRKLVNISIIDWENDGLTSYTGLEVETPIIVITKDFINKSFVPQSPFNDGKIFAELVDKYVVNGASDKYGSPRRTGNIRRIHEGIDLTVPENTPVYPVFPIGIVTEISDDPDHIVMTTGRVNGVEVDTVGVEYGKIVKILYPQGIESLYAHLNEIYVTEGQLVSSNTMVGVSGYTGNIRRSGKKSHLHLELRNKENRSFNPENALHHSQIAVECFIDTYYSLQKEKISE